MVDDLAGDRAEIETRKSAMPSGTDDDEIRVLGSGKDRSRRRMIFNHFPRDHKPLDGTRFQRLGHEPLRYLSRGIFGHGDATHRRFHHGRIPRQRSIAPCRDQMKPAVALAGLIPCPIQCCLGMLGAIKTNHYHERAATGH